MKNLHNFDEEEKTELTPEQQKFIDACDQEITEEIWSSFMIEEDLIFSLFYDLYQEKHLQKYGNYLMPKI